MAWSYLFHLKIKFFEEFFGSYSQHSQCVIAIFYLKLVNWIWVVKGHSFPEWVGWVILELALGWRGSFDILAKTLSILLLFHYFQVCRHFDKVGQLYLNQGFRKLCSFHSSCSKQLKAQLPRRESERRTHPLARHCDILSAVETRLSLLAMTYMKYIEMQLCCFIPGKVRPKKNK